MVTALKSRPGDSGICVALVLVSGYCLFFFFVSFEITLVLDVVSDLWLQPGHLVLCYKAGSYLNLWAEQASSDIGGVQEVLPGHRWAGVDLRLPTQPPRFLPCGCKCHVRPLRFRPAWEGTGAALSLLGGAGTQASLLASAGIIGVGRAHCHAVVTEGPFPLWHYQVGWGWATVFSEELTAAGQWLSKNVLSCWLVLWPEGTGFCRFSLH